MAAIEIDEAELAALKRNSEFLQQGLNNPKARELILKAQKALDPNKAIPELDAREPLLEEIKTLSKRMEDMNKAYEDDKAARDKKEREQALVQQWNASRLVAAKAGYTGDSLKALEDFMEQKGIAEHEIAIPAFERLHPPAQPVAPTGSKFDFFDRQKRNDDANLKRLFEGDEDGFLDSAISGTLKEIRGMVN